MRWEYLRCLLFGCERGEHLAYCVRCGITTSGLDSRLKKWRRRRLIEQFFRGGD